MHKLFNRLAAPGRLGRKLRIFLVSERDRQFIGHGRASSCCDGSSALFRTVVHHCARSIAPAGRLTAHPPGDPRLRTDLRRAHGVALLALYLSAKRDPHPRWSAQLSRVRYRIDTVFGQLIDTVFGQLIDTVFGQLVERCDVKRVWAGDLWHLCSRLLRTVLMHTLPSCSALISATHPCTWLGWSPKQLAHRVSYVTRGVLSIRCCSALCERSYSSAARCESGASVLDGPPRFSAPTSARVRPRANSAVICTVRR